jgi:hypothetical protein
LRKSSLNHRFLHITLARNMDLRFIHRVLCKVYTAALRIGEKATHSRYRIVDTGTLHERDNTRMLDRSRDIDHQGWFGPGNSKRCDGFGFGVAVWLETFCPT